MLGFIDGMLLVAKFDPDFLCCPSVVCCPKGNFVVFSVACCLLSEGWCSVGHKDDQARRAVFVGRKSRPRPEGQCSVGHKSDQGPKGSSL